MTAMPELEQVPYIVVRGRRAAHDPQPVSATDPTSWICNRFKVRRLIEKISRG
jgi:hypothetical protein